MSTLLFRKKIYLQRRYKAAFRMTPQPGVLREVEKISNSNRFFGKEAIRIRNQKMDCFF